MFWRADHQHGYFKVKPTSFSMTVCVWAGENTGKNPLCLINHYITSIYMYMHGAESLQGKSFDVNKGRQIVSPPAQPSNHKLYYRVQY